MSRAGLQHAPQASDKSAAATSLRIGPAHDSFEQEAEQAAKQVTSGEHRQVAWSLSRVGLGPIQRQCSCGGSCEDCKKKKEVLQRNATSSAAVGSHAPASVASTLSRPGSSLDTGTRSFMESRFGQDFSSVRIHTDERAAASARDVSANAYTVGSSIVFNHGKYQPNTPTGRKLLAHELAHVVQQSQNGPASPSNSPGVEQEARSASQTIHTSGASVAIRNPSAVGIARDPAPEQQPLVEVKFPDGVKQLTAEQFAEFKRRSLNNLRVDLNLVTGLADNGRQTQQSMLDEYQGGVESFTDILKKPKALIGIAADIKAGVTPPYIGAWNNSKGLVAQGLAACDRGDLAGAANYLKSADASFRETMRNWNNYREATIGGAEGVASNLETIRDVSFAIALAAGAAVAAPVIAAGVGAGGLGLTGATATLLTTGGTAVVTGAGGAVLGGGSTAIASVASTGKVDIKAVKADAIKFGKQGVVTGLTAGLGSASTGAKLAQPLVKAAAKRCLTEAGVNVAGEVTSQVLDAALPPPGSAQHHEDGEGPKPLVPGPARAALTGCLSGVLGVPIAKLGRTGAKVSEIAVGAGVGYVDARLQGQSNKDALLAAGQNALTSAAIAKGHAGTEHAKAAKAVHASESRGAPAAHAASEHAQTAPAHAEPKAPAAAEHSPTQAATKNAERPVEKIKQKLKAASPHESAPAVIKENAKAKKAIGNGHDAVATEHGVGRCSPSPCPVIHFEYAKELEAHPKLKEINDHVQELRKTNPEAAVEKAAALIRTLEAIRGNSPHAAQAGHEAGPDRRTTKEEWKEQEGKRRWGKAVDEWAEHIDLEKHGEVPRVTGTEASGQYIDDKRVPIKKQARLDLGASPKSKDASIPLLPGETNRQAVQRVKSVIGRKISDIPELHAMWKSARESVLSRNKLTATNYADLYDATRSAFWRRVQGHAGAIEILGKAGIGFTGGPGSAPRLTGTGGALKSAETKVSLDHIQEKAQGDNWKKALDADNLQMEFAMPNTYREVIQARHKELRD